MTSSSNDSPPLNEELTRLEREHECARFKAVFYAGPSALSMHAVPEGRIIDLNEQFAQLVGYERTTLIDQLTTDFQIWAKEGVRDLFFSKLFESHEIDNFETILRCKNGTLKTVLISARLITIEDRSFILSATRDISGRIAREEKLKHSEERYRTIFHSAANMITSVSAEGILLDCNEMIKNVTGYERSEVLGKSMALFIHPEDIPKAQASIQELISTLRPVCKEYRFIHKNGKTIYVTINSAAHLNAQGTFERTICIVNDITELKEAEQEILRLNGQLSINVRNRTEQLRRLVLELTQTEYRERSKLADILHDHLQQLLVAAKMRLVMLQKDDCTHDLSSILQLINESIQATRSLTMELTPPNVQQGSFVQSLRWLCKRMSEHHPLTIALTASADIEHETNGIATSDALLLVFQVIRELLFNIVKHAQTSRANLTLHRVENGNWIQIQVSDQGVGLDWPHLPQSGYGLATARERIHLIGGTLLICSDFGQGSTFSIVAPFPEEHIVTPCNPIHECYQEGRILEHGHQCPRHLTKLRILIVDDHQLIREEMIRLIQSEENFEVVGTASNGEDAITSYEQLQPDLVIMDVNLPRVSGIAATQKIMGISQGKARIIALSMWDEQQPIDAILSAGALAYFNKTEAVQKLLEFLKTLTINK